MNIRRTLSILATICLSVHGADLSTSTALAAPAKGDPLADVDTSKMTPGEKDSLKQLVEKLPSPCGKPTSLATATKDPTCKRAPLAVKALQTWLMNGFLQSEVEERYAQRYPKKLIDIDIAGAAVRGDPKAPVTIVEFSDFECPHCKLAEPMLAKLLTEYPHKVRLVFMNYPLPMHPNAAQAAAAAVAAGKQGKFWAYHDRLFDNQGKFSPVELLKYATDLKLDLGRFQADMEGAKVRVAKERGIGEKLELTGTPAFFVNGRRYSDPPTIEAMRGWVEEEVGK